MRTFQVRFLAANGACLWECMVRTDTIVLAMEKAFSDLPGRGRGIDLDRITRAEIKAARSIRRAAAPSLN